MTTGRSNARILVTGANGFVGRALVPALAKRGHFVRSAVRRPENADSLPAGSEVLVVGDIDACTKWAEATVGIDVVVHLAARVHVMHDAAANPLEEFRRINVEGAAMLAREAADAGVRRFVLVSSIKVNGEGTPPGRPYTADDHPAPVDPYGISKYEAEQRLAQVARDTGMELTIIRPVMVYGPGVRANFLSMIRWLQRGVPLPFGAIDNRRSLVAVGNLADLIAVCVNHPSAANQTFLVSDGETLSTTALLRRTAAAMNRRARLISVPVAFIWAGARLLGRRDLAQRLCGSLEVDISKTRDVLGWTPPVGVDDALRDTVLALAPAAPYRATPSPSRSPR